jgi:hypothetical protein
MQVKNSSANIQLGDRYGRLIILSKKIITKNNQNKKAFLCRCDCGKEKIIRIDALISGRSNSCGCLQKEAIIAAHLKHGESVVGKRTRLYIIWSSMKNRCFNPNSKSFKNYGGKGISIIKEWLNYKIFKSWALSNGYSDKLTIDRINSNMGYCPSNCRWISKAENTSLAHLGIERTDNHSIIALNKSGDIVGIFSSQLDVQRKLGINASNISQALSGNRKTAGGYKWKYQEVSNG